MSNYADPGSSRYDVRVKGHLDQRRVDWLGVLSSCTGFDANGTPVTTLRVPLIDQAGLHGLLNKIRDMGLELLWVERIAQSSGGPPS